MHYKNDEGAVKQVLHIHRLMEKRVGRKVTKASVHPLWYRGLSEVQLEAAKGLSVALNGDMLQSSTYRVDEKLGKMGVMPRPPQRHLPLLYRMSRGNDVAFLWFLMEMFYKSESHEHSYGYNEQIIMSAIFWLDLQPTLYELDRVLPMPQDAAEVREQQAKAEARRRKLMEQEARLEAKKRQMKAVKKSPQPERHSMRYKLPYFQTPVPFKHRRSRLLAPYPKRDMSVKKLPPEPPPKSSPLFTRWFGNFSLSEGQRVVTSMLNEELKGIVGSLKAAKLKASHVEGMCKHHTKIKAMEQSLHANLEKIKQEKLQKLFDVDLRYKQRTRQRVMAELERLSTFYEDKFHKMALQTRLASTRKRLCLDTHDPGFIYVKNEESDKDWLDELCAVKSQAEDSCKPLRTNELLTPSCIAPTQVKKRVAKETTLPWDNEAPLPKLKSSLSNESRPSRLMQFLQQGGTETEQACAESSTHTLCPCCSKSSQYFEAGRNAYDYRFNYHRLFGPNKDKLLDNQQLRLKAEFIKALDDDVEYLNAILRGEKYGSVDALVQRSVKNLFTTGTKMFEEQYSEMEKTFEKVSKRRLDFGQDYIDATDTALMKEMLRLGLERVATDHRYVLPTLPDVHSVPLLIEWICARYGKRYTLAESQLSFRKDKYLMENLAMILTHEIMRVPLNFGKNLTSCGQKICSKTQLRNEMKNFRLRFILGIMELGRAFNSIMKNNENHNMYYAYMPAHISDVHFGKTTPFFERRRRKEQPN